MVMTCDVCGREFGSGAALASHKRSRHGDMASWGPNRRALEATLRKLRSLGRLETVDAALVQLARSLAGSVDCDSSNAQLCRTYHDILEALVGEREDTDSFAKLIAEINSRAPLGHPPETGA